MSRPGNTKRITDSTKNVDAAQSIEATEVRSAHGQPRPSGLEITRMPSAAERTRTLVQSTSSAVLLIPGVEAARPEQLTPQARAVGPDGEVFLLFPADSPAVRAATHAQDDELSAVLEITDVAPVSVPNRIRGRAWVSGWLTCVPGLAEPGRMMVRLEVGEACVDDLWGADNVEPEEFARASVDPFVAHETELLQHLHSAHSEQVQALCGLIGERSETGIPPAEVPQLPLGGAPRSPAFAPRPASRIWCVVRAGGGGFPHAFESPVGPGWSDAHHDHSGRGGAVPSSPSYRWEVPPAGSETRGRVARPRCSPHRAGKPGALESSAVSASAGHPTGWCRPGRPRRSPSAVRRPSSRVGP
jgi:hypothetical protein